VDHRVARRFPSLWLISQIVAMQLAKMDCRARTKLPRVLAIAPSAKFIPLALASNHFVSIANQFKN
jgi:hypothetical protein